MQLPGSHSLSRWCHRTALCAAVLAPFWTARAQIAVVGNTVEEHTGAPGETYTGSILVRNLTKQAQPVRIYQTDYTFFADGTSHFDTVGTVARSNAKWITLSTSSFVAPPSGDVTVAYTIAVPAGDSLRGTYWSTVMIEGATEAPPEVSAKPQIGLGVVIRYAVQLATHIQSTGTRKIDLTDQHVQFEKDSSQALELTFTNVGERAYRPLLWVEVYDDKGAMRVTQKQQRGLLYPGTSAKQKFALGNLPAGSYKAIVFADVGNDEVVAAQYRLKF